VCTDLFVAWTGILTSALVSLMGQARIYVVLGRERLLPPGLAALHPHRKTPVNATILTAVSGGGRDMWAFGHKLVP
jgi:APA family basic amino acid/polyamine antiporter